MIEDMGVPSHACHVPHGKEYLHVDCFELMSAFNWAPDYRQSWPWAEPNGTCNGDPGYGNPADYYRFSQRWALYDLANEPAPKDLHWPNEYWVPPADPSNEDPTNTGEYGTCSPMWAPRTRSAQRGRWRSCRNDGC